MSLEIYKHCLLQLTALSVKLPFSSKRTFALDNATAAATDDAVAAATTVTATATALDLKHV